MYNDKQYHTRRLKPLKTILNPTVYQFILWTTNQKWWYDFKHYTKVKNTKIKAMCVISISIKA